MKLHALIANLRSGALDLLDYLDWLEICFREWEPRVSAFVPEDGRFHRLRHEAQGLLAQHPDPSTRPPLFGLPIGVKDIFHVAGFTTRAGGQLPPELLQGSEAKCVSILRRAGALILGKTVTTEFAYFGPGPTRNPHNPAHTPGGSSSGSAAAVGAGLAPFALGTQTIGSINRPAAFCGVIGFKPSYGRIATEGVIPLSVSLDHVGFFADDVAGAAVVAGLLCRRWRGRQALIDRKPVLAVPEGVYLEQVEPEGADHFRETCARLGEAGFTVKSIAALPDFHEVRRQHLVLMAAEAARFHAAWFERFEQLYHPKTAELIRQGLTYSDGEIATALAYKDHLRQRLMALMNEHHLDVWISPSATGPAPAGLGSTGDPVMNLPWTNAGLPTLTLPTGFHESGLPLALQLTGRWFADERLLAFGMMIERLGDGKIRRLRDWANL